MIERDDLRFVAYVPDQVQLKVEFEIEDDVTELEIELPGSRYSPTGGLPSRLLSASIT